MCVCVCACTHARAHACVRIHKHARTYHDRREQCRAEGHPVCVRGYVSMPPSVTCRRRRRRRGPHVPSARHTHTHTRNAHMRPIPRGVEPASGRPVVARAGLRGLDPSLAALKSSSRSRISLSGESTPGTEGKAEQRSCHRLSSIAPARLPPRRITHSPTPHPCATHLLATSLPHREAPRPDSRVPGSKPHNVPISDIR